jgi:hypothetical protein
MYVQGLIKISGTEFFVGNIPVRVCIIGELCSILMASVLVFRFDWRVLVLKVLLKVNQV